MRKVEENVSGIKLVLTALQKDASLPWKIMLREIMQNGVVKLKDKGVLLVTKKHTTLQAT